MASSNSNNAAPDVLVTPPPTTAVPQLLPTPAINIAAPALNAPGHRENTPAAGTAPSSSHSITCTPAVGGPSTLAELDAIKVAKIDR
jgi:hypothetical protein